MSVSCPKNAVALKIDHKTRVSSYPTHHEIVQDEVNTMPSLQGYKGKCSTFSPVATHAKSHRDTLEPSAEEICVPQGIGEVSIFPRLSCL